jgi:multidrug efflux pump subunit AcrA (membrane-fusion protein)
MKKLFMSRSFHVMVVVVVILFIVYMIIGVRNNQPVEYVTAIVEQGSVQQLVSVSGVIEAEQKAELAFPTTGIVAAVNISKGDVVQAGEILISLEARTLGADRLDAVAARARAVATRDELLAGPQVESREATAEAISFKATTLETIKATQVDLVSNAYRTLLSSDLTATTKDPNEEAVAPSISGTYTCDEVGIYELEMYSSGSNSGYSYRLSGLESGTFVASFDQIFPLGTCGLQALFDADSQYSNADWMIEIPNKNSPKYISNRNAYTLAQTQAASAITLAEQDLVLAQVNAASTNAPARSEAIARANADIASANARVARVDAQIADRTIRAPFAGTIVEVDILPGETVTTIPVITILAASDFELTARIPEIDIGKLETGQRVRAAFDAKADVMLDGTVDFISLQATEIDGVAYYEAIISLEETPTWMRSGLNADIDIIIIATNDSLRVPKRFVTETDGMYQVITKTGDLLATTTINVTLEGNDGYIAITGVNLGDILVAP